MMKMLGKSLLEQYQNKDAELKTITERAKSLKIAGASEAVTNITSLAMAAVNLENINDKITAQ